MSWDVREDKIVFDEDFFDGEECPMCHSYNTSTKRSYEDSDADGRRGRLVEYVKCSQCGYDESF